MPAIQVMIKPASGQCNMRCTYCFYTDEMNHRTEASCGVMEDSVLEAVIQKVLLFAEHSCSIVFQGGEPTLAGLDFYRKCLSYEKMYNIHHVQIFHAIQTNGTLIDEKWSRFLAENHFLVGLSIDGLKSAHDCFRKDAAGRDTYFRVLDAAAKLTMAGADFNVLTVVNRRTAPRIRKIYEQYRKLGFHYQQYIICLDPINEPPGQQDYSLTPQAYGQFLIDLFRLWQTDLRQGKAPYIRQFDNYLAILAGERPEACEQQGFCSAQLVIEADGSVYPCDFYVLDNFRLGNLTSDSFEELEQKRLELQFLERSRIYPDECRKCRWFDICRCGCCRHREMTAHGQNFFCESYRMFFDTCFEELHEAAVMYLRSKNR